MVFPRDLLIIFLGLQTSIGGPIFRGGLRMIWKVVIWSIWKTWNDIVFSGTSVTPKGVEDMNIYLAWY